MTKKMIFEVERREGGERLDRFLQERTGLSRKKVKGLLDQGRVTLDKRKVIIASWEVKVGQKAEVLEESLLHHPDAEGHYLKVVYEDADLLVVEKDAGTLCEQSTQAIKPTLPEIINAYFKRKQPHIKRPYLGLVHRLDRDTSGLMVYSKSETANRLTDQFKRHTIVRKYLAIVSGQVENDRGQISSFLKKNPLLKGGKKVQSSTQESGQKAVTHWVLLERYPKVSLLEVTLNTGRTHQIRVHLASIGHPVLGDSVYGKVGDHRQALHASYLEFHHPITGKNLEFSSKLPRDLRRLVDRLRDQV